MQEALISRRRLMKASAAMYLVSLVPVPVEACQAPIPGGYVAWIRHRGRDGWTVTCASRRGDGNFSVISTIATVLTAKGSAPVDLAKEMILADFAGKAKLRPQNLAFKDGHLGGEGLRIPVSIWVDFA